MSDEKAIDSTLEPLDEEVNLAKKFGHIEKDGPGAVENNKESGAFSAEKKEAKEVLATEKDATYDEVLSKITQKSTTSDDDEVVKTDASVVAQKMDVESQIQHLVDLATTKGVVHAVKVAKHMDDNYVLDSLHDKIISEEFHKALRDKDLLPSE